MFDDAYLGDLSSISPDKVIENISDFGIVTFSVDSGNARHALVGLAQALGEIRSHPHSDRDGATSIAPRRDNDLHPGRMGFTQERLLPHTDASSMASPPDLLLNVCATRAEHGGETLLVDMRSVLTQALKTNPVALERLSAPGTVIFGTGGFSRASSVFAVRNGRIHVRFRQDEGVFFGAPVLKEALELIGLVDAMTVRMSLEEGQGYIVDNHWWLHGRASFAGPREIIRILADVRADRSGGVGETGFPWHVSSTAQEKIRVGTVG
ncbi:Taurine catabolism dioxygenase TauD, TfdA family [Stappia sp. ES.058]|nr:Taurine catabolism dioxygenase TauD, TfdA family [Stappia sp. ES.058]